MPATGIRFGAAEPPRPGSADTTVGVETVAAVAAVLDPAAFETSGYIDHDATVVMTIA